MWRLMAALPPHPPWSYLTCWIYRKTKNKKLCTALRRSFGTTTAVEFNIFEKMDAMHLKLGEFYESKTEQFLENNEVVSRSLVYVKDTSDFIRQIIEDRGLSFHNSIVRIRVADPE